MVFNLDSSVSNDELRQIFGAYGEIKEVNLWLLSIIDLQDYDVGPNAWSVLVHVFTDS